MVISELFERDCIATLSSCVKLPTVFLMGNLLISSLVILTKAAILEFVLREGKKSDFFLIFEVSGVVVPNLFGQ